MGDESREGLVRRIGNSVREIYYDRRGLHPFVYSDIPRDAAAETRAKQAVEDFLRLSSQEPTATFLPDSDSVIDLSKTDPGTIMRLTSIAPDDQVGEPPPYHWFIFGEKAGVYYTINVFPSHAREPRLPVEGNVDVQPEVPLTIKEFPARDAFYYLSGWWRLKALEQYNNDPRMGRTGKVDIMSLGKPAKREVTEKTPPQVSPALKPATEPA